MLVPLCPDARKFASRSLWYSGCFKKNLHVVSRKAPSEAFPSAGLGQELLDISVVTNDASCCLEIIWIEI